MKQNWLDCRKISDFSLVCLDSKSLGNTGIIKSHIKRSLLKESWIKPQFEVWRWHKDKFCILYFLHHYQNNYQMVKREKKKN
jgi:hypothetical protein